MSQAIPPPSFQPGSHPQATPPREPFDPLALFLGADGLRAGWSILLFLALFIAFENASIWLLHAILNPPSPATGSLLTAQSEALSEGLPLLCTLLATWIMAVIERRPPTTYGLKRKQGLRNFSIGLVSGITLLSLLILILRLAGLLVFSGRLLFGSDTLRYGLIWLGIFLLVGLLEETLARGYLQFTLTRGFSGIFRHLVGQQRAAATGFWSAALVLSFAFGLLHRSNPGESPIGVCAAGLIGLVFCLSLWRTGSLWWAIGFHTAWDWAESFLYGVADSGGTIQHRLFAAHPAGRPILSGGLTGPEGSIYVLAVLALAVIAILLTLPRTAFVDPPPAAAPPTLH